MGRDGGELHHELHDVRERQVGEVLVADPGDVVALQLVALPVPR